MKSVDDNPMKAVRRLEITGYGLIALLFGGFGVWAATSDIAGAVIAGGTLVVQSDVKKVQHPTGGVIAAINVREGDHVKEGEVLIQLDDTVARATVGVVRVQLDEMSAKLARLTAERDGMDHIDFPSSLLARRDEPQVAASILGEQKLFESRRTALAGQRAQLEQRVAQAGEEVRGLEAQQTGKEQEISFIDKEYVAVADLWHKNLVGLNVLMQLNRDKARLSGDRGQDIAEIARAQGKISETKLQILQLGTDFRTEVLKEIGTTQSKIGELTERLVAAQDQLKRVDIRAPRDGVVNQLEVHTVGGVISNGETLMEIVPGNDDLIIEAKILPRDIDQVHVGEDAIIRLLAGEERANPDLTGKVEFVSADLVREAPQPGVAQRAYYSVRVSLSKKEVERLGSLKLLPGMQAEVFVKTYQRTAISYLIKPLKDQMERAFRER